MTATPAERYDLVVIGLGPAGRTAAELAAALDLKVAAVERDRARGGRSTAGAAGSKVLVGAGKLAEAMRHADRFGLPAHAPAIDTELVWKRAREAADELASADLVPSPNWHLDIVSGDARLLGPTEVAVRGLRGTDVLATRYVLLCTGSRPAVPVIAGLPEVGFLTSDSLFDERRPPRSLVFLGGGPTSVELAQACQRLDIPTTILQDQTRLLPGEEPILVDVLTKTLRTDGVTVATGVHVHRVAIEHGRKVAYGSENGRPGRWVADELVVATGRVPVTDGLGLDDLGIASGPRGIEVDERGRTALRTVYAAGDVAGRHGFAHAASHEAARVVRDAFFPGTGKVDPLVPWCVLTDPELAHAGLTIAEAEARHGDDVDVWRSDLTASNEPTTRPTRPAATAVVVTAKGRIVGAHVLAPGAGEMIHELALAIRHNLRLEDVAALVHAEPTLSASIGRLASESTLERAQKLRFLVRRR